MTSLLGCRKCLLTFLWYLLQSATSGSSYLYGPRGAICCTGRNNAHVWHRHRFL